MAKGSKYNLGDVFIIQLEEEKNGIGRILKKDQSTIFIELYNVVFNELTANICTLYELSILFKSWCYDTPIRKGNWKVINNIPLDSNDEMPYFWSYDSGYDKYYISKGTDTFETDGKKIEISKEEIVNYEAYGIASQYYIHKSYIKKLNQIGLW